MLIKSKTTDSFVTDKKDTASSSTVIDRNNTFPITKIVLGIEKINYNRPP